MRLSDHQEKYDMSNQYPDAVLAKGPVAYWRLGDAPAMTAVDQTGNGHDGAYRAAPIMPTTGAITGDPDTAFPVLGHFTVEIPDSVDFSQPTSGAGLTVEAWFRPDLLTFTGETSENYVHWIGKGETGQYEWGFRFYPLGSSRPNRVSAYIWNLGGGEAPAPTLRMRYCRRVDPRRRLLRARGSDRPHRGRSTLQERRLPPRSALPRYPL